MERGVTENAARGIIFRGFRVVFIRRNSFMHCVVSGKNNCEATKIALKFVLLTRRSVQS